MKRTLLAVALLLVVAGTMVATGAISVGEESDDLGPANQSGVVLAPADTDNGERYARLDDAGELNVTLDTIPGTSVRINDVFVLGFEGRSNGVLPAEVEIEHESERLRIRRMDTGDRVGSEPISLDPNESVRLGFEVEAGTDAPDSFVETVSYRATVPSSKVSIDFDLGTRETKVVPRVDPSETNETDDANLTDPPEAVVDRTTGEGLPFANEMNVTDAQATDADDVVRVGETVSLSGERSLVDTSYAVDTDRRLVSLFDIPANENEENESATIRVPVDAGQFNGTDPSDATIARQTGGDWQSLPTTVNESADEGVSGQVILQARTPGFSVFGVFAESQTTYTWETEDGRTAEGATADFTFDEPGLHRVNLTVTDAFGRSDTSTYRVLANDPPSVEIEPEEVPTNETVQLRADVTNVAGEETITWRFADGSTATGTAVERRFESGEVVNVTVEDEFGATGTDDAVAGPQGANPILNVFQWRLGFGGRIAVVAVLALLIIRGLRWFAGRRYYREDRETDRGRV